MRGRITVLLSFFLWQAGLPLRAQEQHPEEALHPDLQRESEEGGDVLEGQILPPQEVIVELPDWSPGQVRELDHNAAPSNLGGGLWPETLWPLMPSPEPLPALSEGAAKDEASTPRLMTALPPELVAAYDASLPAKEIHDPQDLLEREKARQIGRFIADCSKTGNAQLRVLIFAENQEPPPSLTPEGLAERWFPSGDGAVAFYFIGQPDRSALGYSSSLSSRFEADSLEKFVLQPSIREAEVVERPGEQLARFCIKFSLRLYALAKNQHDETVILKTRAPKQGRQPSSLHWVIGLAGLAGLISLTSFLLARYKGAKRKLPPPCLLPEQEIIPRLGGEHSGGGCAVMKF